MNLTLEKRVKYLETLVQAYGLLIKATCKRVDKNELDIDIMQEDMVEMQEDTFKSDLGITGHNNRIF